MEPGARISRVHNSWRVRVPGFKPHFFADQKHDSTLGAYVAAKEWRDANWDGKDRSCKLSHRERAIIRYSKEHYKVVAERFGISPNYVHKIRRRFHGQ